MIPPTVEVNEYTQVILSVWLVDTDDNASDHELFRTRVARESAFLGLQLMLRRWSRAP